jgi:hypothetical protein
MVAPQEQVLARGIAHRATRVVRLRRRAASWTGRQTVLTESTPMRDAELMTQTPENPVAAYCDFLHAIKQHDLVRVLARMPSDYGHELRSMQAEPAFSIFFSLWCDTYPEDACIVDSKIGPECAVVEIAAQIEGLAVSGYAVLDRIGTRWYVSAESYGETGWCDLNEVSRPVLHHRINGGKNGF